VWRRLAWVGLLVAGTAVLFLVWFSQSTEWVRDRVVTALNARFAGAVELKSLQLALLPRPRASGTGLVFRQNGRTDVPPLVTIGDFNGSAGIADTTRIEADYTGTDCGLLTFTGGVTLEKQDAAHP